MDSVSNVGSNKLDNPWPDSNESIDNNIINFFDDNFDVELWNIKSDDELNENGLRLPDSKQYLDTLENKLFRLKVPAGTGVQTNDKRKAALNRAIVKEMLKSLALKRDEAFDHDIDRSDSSLFLNECSDLDFKRTLPSTITNSALFNTIEKKLFPHLQALNEDELKTLINSDLLDAICKLNLEKDDNANKSGINDVNKVESSKDDQLD